MTSDRSDSSKRRGFLWLWLLLTVVWFAGERWRFQGPPQGMMIQQRQAEIAAAEKAVGQA